MRVAILDTYYPGFLESVYQVDPGLAERSYESQKERLLKGAFGTSDFYSRHLRELGCDVQDFIVNCAQLQTSWARENRVRYSNIALSVPHRAKRFPFISSILSRLPGLVEIAVQQICQMSPDVLYCQDLWFLPPSALDRIRASVGIVVGQIASPLPGAPYLRSYDLVMTSFPHFVPRLRAIGVNSEYFRIGFDESILSRVGVLERDIPVSFVGGISRHHGQALPMLEYLARSTPIKFFGYGAGNLRRGSPIAASHQGEVWGLDMYRALARSRITLNRHINVAENYSNNMRLYEATGVGTLLITDRKDNLGELFDVGREVVAYSGPEEAAELIRHYISHPHEASEIARAGQARTLYEHTYQHRMTELLPILEKYLAQVR
jgi:spore maturation protein CgeB